MSLNFSVQIVWLSSVGAAATLPTAVRPEYTLIRLGGWVWKCLACFSCNEHKLLICCTGSKICSARSFFCCCYFVVSIQPNTMCGLFFFFSLLQQMELIVSCLPLLWCRLALYPWGDREEIKQMTWLLLKVQRARALIEWLLKRGVWLDNLSRHDHLLLWFIL